MKSKKLFSGIVLALSIISFAQENPNHEKQMKSYAAKIDSIIIAEKTKMNTELDVVDAKFNNGKISEDEKTKQRNEIASRYEKSINEKVANQKNELEAITSQLVKSALMGNKKENGNPEIVFTSNRSIIEFKESKKSAKDLLKTNYLVYSIGFNNLTKSGESMDLFKNSSGIRSTLNSGAIQFRADRQIGNFTSPVFFRYGFGWRGDDYLVSKPNYFVQNNNKLSIDEFTNGSLKRSKISINYIEVPLDIQFVLNPKYIVEDGVKYLDNSKKQFKVGLGIYGDYKIGSKIHLKYADQESSKNLFKQKIENGVNDFVFGGKFNIGYGGINLYLKKDLTPTFTKDALWNDKYSLQFGIELMNLNL